MCGADHGASSEADLICGLRRGEVGAFDALFDRHRAGVFAYALAMLHDRGIAEDVVQEVFVEMARRADRLDPARGAAAWLYRVARNRAIDRLRRRRRLEFPGDDVLAERGARVPDPGSAPDAGLADAETAAGLRRAVDALPERERDVLLMRFYGGLTFQEVARAVRRPLGTVLWQAHRALGRLRAAMPSAGELR